MRRSFLFIGIAAVAVGVGAVAYSRTINTEREREHHIIIIRDNALCEKSLEMAASFSSYNHESKLAESIVLTNSWLTQSLNIDLRRQAYGLGFTQFEYDAILKQARYDAERTLIPQINNASDPAAKALELAQTCVPWPLDSYSN